MKTVKTRCMVYTAVLIMSAVLLAMSCKNPAAPEPEKWNTVTGIDQLRGTWKGDIRQQIQGVPGTVSADITMQYPFTKDENAYLKASAAIDMTAVISMTVSNSQGQVTEEDVWNSFKNANQDPITTPEGIVIGITCSEGKPYMMNAEILLPEQIIIPMMNTDAGTVLINGSGTKLKFKSTDTSTNETMEFILSRQ